MRIIILVVFVMAILTAVSAQNFKHFFTRFSPYIQATTLMRDQRSKRDTSAHQPQCHRENEEYQCGSACQTTCHNLGESCPIVNIRCNDACYCIDGYVRTDDDTSKCIPKSECPS